MARKPPPLPKEKAIVYPLAFVRLVILHYYETGKIEETARKHHLDVAQVQAWLTDPDPEIQGYVEQAVERIQSQMVPRATMLANRLLGEFEQHLDGGTATLDQKLKMYTALTDRVQTWNEVTGGGKGIKKFGAASPEQLDKKYREIGLMREALQMAEAQMERELKGGAVEAEFREVESGAGELHTGTGMADAGGHREVADGVATSE